VVRVALLTAALLALPAARAGEPPRIKPQHRKQVNLWPQPAAGESASGNPEVLFTFDDGPHEDWTPIILDELERRGLKAVFFWAGWRVEPERRHGKKRRALFARAVAEGHLVGNHTVNHAMLCLVDRKTAEYEIDENTRRFEELAGMPITWFRVPYGNKCRRLERQLAERGLAHLHWDIDPLEWQYFTPREIRDRVVSRLRKLEGRAVVLMHDTHPWGAHAFPLILAWIDGENARRRARGLKEIKILSYADLAREQLPPGLDQAVDDVAGAALDFAAGVAGDLLLPLAPVPRAAKL
jgi:peptidoglycan/xylan/chitin deacetylase (PgdA/CDA1 family)